MKFAAALAVIALAAVVLVASTHRTFSAVIDEPVHIMAGFAMLSGERYLFDGSHPPLERLLSAIPLKLEGIELPPDQDRLSRGNQILYAGQGYVHNLARARIANLLFLLLAIVSTALWARRRFSDPVALLSAVILVCIPPFLGHAGLATTDLAVAALLPLCFLTLERWLDQPTLRRGMLLGMCCGIAMLTKFSFVVFFPVGAVVVIALEAGNRERRHGRRTPNPLPAIIVAMVVVWAGYFFEFGRIADTPGAEKYVVEPLPQIARPAASWIAQHVPVPAPIFWVGLGSVQLHNRAGHPAFLLGRYSDDGWWYYFPVVLFFKTPIAFLLLVLIGATRREALPFALIALAMLAAAMTSSINIGVRHVLAIYPPLAIVAAVGLVYLWKYRVAAIALAAWLVIGTARAYPDYMAWFNELAGGHPEKIAVDSNLDWGQDVLRLSRSVRELHIDTLHTIYAGSAWLHEHGINALPVPPNTPTWGWIAVSETALAMQNRNGEYRWLEKHRPVRRIGKSIRLYHVWGAAAPGGARRGGPPRPI